MIQLATGSEYGLKTGRPKSNSKKQESGETGIQENNAQMGGLFQDLESGLSQSKDQVMTQRWMDYKFGARTPQTLKQGML